MNTATLRGVFPESKPAHRRNFIKENVKQIRQMQLILHDAGVMPHKSKEDKFRNVPRSREIPSQPHHHGQVPQSLSHGKLCVNKGTKTLGKGKVEAVKKEKFVIEEPEEVEARFTHRSMQTEKTEDLNKLYESGVIKYASGQFQRSRRLSLPKGKGQGDAEEISSSLQSMDLDEKNYIRENMKNFKPKPSKEASPKVPANAPPTYQKGVLPKYLRERKEDTVKEAGDVECPPGHVLLPEEERKETLRVLRQSYADRIQELNSMPVRNDTLRMKKRKMEIEEELKRIDGGIKVFQRPKVFVKINA